MARVCPLSADPTQPLGGSGRELWVAYLKIYNVAMHNGVNALPQQTHVLLFEQRHTHVILLLHLSRFLVLALGCHAQRVGLTWHRPPAGRFPGSKTGKTPRNPRFAPGSPACTGGEKDAPFFGGKSSKQLVLVEFMVSKQY